jgi:hypothetical protein
MKDEGTFMDISHCRMMFFIAATLVAGAGSAHATLSLDYTIGSSNPDASIYYTPVTGSGGDASLHASNIAVTQITGIETSQNSGPAKALTVSGGVLSITTGSFTGKDESSDMWKFGGGTITVTGGILPLSIANGSTLLSGIFTSASVTELPLTGLLKFDIVGATFAGTDHPDIYRYFGIPVNSSSSDGLNLSFMANAGTLTHGFSSITIAGGTVADVPSPTPIPATACLLGSGLMGLFGIRRKNR